MTDNDGPRVPRKAIQSDEAYTEIVRAARELRIRAALSPIQRRRVLECVTILDDPQTAPKRQQYRIFLYDVHSRCGPHGVLLCAITLGQHKVTTMRKRSRSDLISTLERFKNDCIINCPLTRSLANEHGIPQELECMAYYASSSMVMANLYVVVNSIEQPSSAESSYNSSNFDCTSPQPSGQSRNSSVGNSIVYSNMGHMDSASQCHSFASASNSRQHVPLEVVERVFNNNISSAIRKVPVEIDGTTVYKAAIVVTFPSSGPVECLLSIDVEEWAVDHLIRTLFNLETFRLDQTWCVILSGGARLKVSEPNLTVTSARDGPLLAVLGPKLYQAIQESSIRKKELEAGKQETECVSISLIDGGAILNLCLSLDAGIDIKNNLFDSSS